MKQGTIQLLIASLFFFGLHAQDSISIQFKPVVNKDFLQLGKTYTTNNNVSFSVTSLKFYISEFKISFSDTTDIIINESWLIDAERPESMLKLPGICNDKPIKGISFTLGVPVNTNTAGALGGDLDPSNGMYWAWQSGYINFKIEGQSVLCNTHNNEFGFHIGGYKHNENTARNIFLSYPNVYNGRQINIFMDLQVLLGQINLSQTNNVVVPGIEAMKIADNLIKIFRVYEMD